MNRPPDASPSPSARSEPRLQRADGGGPVDGILEAWVADCWEWALGVERPGREDHLTGVDAAATARLVDIAAERFGLRLPADWPARLPTVSRQAEAIEPIAGFEPRAMVPLRQDGRGPVCVLIPGMGGHAWTFERLSQRLTEACDIWVLNQAGLRAPGGRGPRDRLLEAIASCNPDPSRQRPVIVGGYSFGCLVACAEDKAIADHFGRLDRLALMDPWPLEMRRRSLRIRLMLKSFRDWIRPRKWEKHGSAFGRELETQIHDAGLYLFRLYLGAPARTGAPLSVMLTERGRQQVEAVDSLFGRPIQSVDLQYTPSGHLDLIRGGQQGEVAAWFDDQIRLTRGSRAGDAAA